MNLFTDQKLDKFVQETIIEDLACRSTRQDNLDGILLGVYEKVIHQLTTEILKNI